MQQDRPADASQREEKLAALLADLSERAAQGESIDIHAIAGQQPELGDELVQLWGAVMLANAMGSDASRQRQAEDFGSRFEPLGGRL